jgi:hypothetical protein
LFVILIKVIATLIDSPVKTTAESQPIVKPNLLVTTTQQSHFSFRKSMKPVSRYSEEALSLVTGEKKVVNHEEKKLKSSKGRV